MWKKRTAFLKQMKREYAPVALQLTHFVSCSEKLRAISSVFRVKVVQVVEDFPSTQFF